MATKKRAPTKTVVPLERITESILWLRGQKVMLSYDLALLYGVEVRVLMQAIKRNAERFPEDFFSSLQNRKL